MASALWLGSMEPQQLSLFLSLPVQVAVAPAGQLPRLAGQRLSGRDIYYLSVGDWQTVLVPPVHGRLTALGLTPPPAGLPVTFIPTPPQEQYAALCRLLPLTEPETIYITGGEVRCSVVEEDYLPLLERLGRL